MGTLAMKDPHGKRSSSMSFARRWKRENSRTVIMIVFVSFVLLGLLFWLWLGLSEKRVTLIVDGKSTVVETNQRNVQQLLDEQNLVVGKHDKVSEGMGAEIEDGDSITIAHAKPVQFTADGSTRTVYTTGRTVREMLKELQIALGAEDKVIPSLDATVSAKGGIQVIRVRKVTEKQKQILPFHVVKTADPSIFKGKVRMLQAGKEGVAIQHIEKIFEDGQMVTLKVVKTTVERKSVDKVMAVGTKKPVTILSAASPSVKEVTVDGVSFGIKQVLNNVTLTAYTAGVSSTGKTKEHAQYGITYSGTRVTEGRTISVDPKVVPMGWWVYIDGLGLRRAEDIGSAVKGKHIDVYYEDQDYAERFGLKRGVTVYVVGPKKPTSN